MPDIIQGQARRVAFECRNLDGDLVDPVTIHFIYKYGTTKTTLVYGIDIALVKDSTGKYHVDLAFIESGEWLYRIAFSGASDNAAQGKLYVAPALL